MKMEGRGWMGEEEDETKICGGKYSIPSIRKGNDFQP